MRKANIFVHGIFAGVLEEIKHDQYTFTYDPNYVGSPVSLSMPLQKIKYEFNEFPAFFEGLLPEGIMLEALLRNYKIDKKDFFGQLLIVGNDVVGAVTIEEAK